MFVADNLNPKTRTKPPTDENHQDNADKENLALHEGNAQILTSNIALMIG